MDSRFRMYSAHTINYLLKHVCNKLFWLLLELCIMCSIQALGEDYIRTKNVICDIHSRGRLYCVMRSPNVKCSIFSPILFYLPCTSLIFCRHEGFDTLHIYPCFTYECKQCIKSQVTFLVLRVLFGLIIIVENYYA